MYAVNDVVGGAPYPHHARLDQSTFFSPRFHRVIHVMRNPLAQISALTAHLPDSYAHIRTHMLLKNDSWVQRHRHKVCKHCYVVGVQLGPFGMIDSSSLCVLAVINHI